VRRGRPDFGARQLALVGVVLSVIALALSVCALVEAGDAATRGCETRAFGVTKYRLVVGKAFSKERWRDATPMRAGERRELARWRRCAADSRTRKAMKRIQRRAKDRFHANFRDMIAPPGRGTLEAIAACESGGNPRAVSPNGAYRGKYQFDFQTWGSVGGQGDPAVAPEREQDYRAARLHRARGSQPWPRCGVA
jgi:hypothetical protein